MEQCLAEFGLAEQEYLQQRMTAELEVRQHPQLFERRDGQILPLVDDQQRAAPGARLFAQILFHRPQQFGLALPLPRDARSEERRVGKEWVSPCSSGWEPYH